MSLARSPVNIHSDGTASASEGARGRLKRGSGMGLGRLLGEQRGQPGAVAPRRGQEHGEGPGLPSGTQGQCCFGLKGALVPQPQHLAAASCLGDTWGHLGSACFLQALLP